MLDFEKAYDRLEWSFLESPMAKMGFSQKWIKGVSSLYSCATSKVMIVGEKGLAFKLTRSVRQGCPMEPYLFLFFTEALSAYLAADFVGLKGLQISPVKQLLNAKFVDDTTMYVDGSLDTLLKVEKH